MNHRTTVATESDKGPTLIVVKWCWEKENGPILMDIHDKQREIMQKIMEGPKLSDLVFFSSFILHLPTFHWLGFCWDDHSRPQNRWDGSQLFVCYQSSIPTKSHLSKMSWNPKQKLLEELQRSLRQNFSIINIWIFGHLNIWPSEHLTSEHLNIWTLEHLNIEHWTLNILTF